ncbi:ABC transporter ATP-binding protein/permease [Gammaproteobacteria bacterium]|nr:ABC transporter ATP-binding protein/permease [Gammaproteobacteria bacterium]
MLVLISFMEVFGLALISFLLVNLQDLSNSIQALPFMTELLTFLGISNNHSTLLFCISILIYSIATLIFSIFIIRSVNLSGQLIGSRLRQTVVKHYLNADWINLSSAHASELISKILNDGRQMGFLISFCLHLFSRFILTLLIITGLFIYNASLTTVLVAVLSFAYLLIIVMLQSSIRRHGANTALMLDASLKILTNIFSSIKEVIFYGAQEKFISDFRKIDTDLVYSEASNASLSQIPRFLIDTFILMALVVSIFYFSLTGFENEKFFTSIAVYGLAALKLLPSFQNIYYFYHEITSRHLPLSNILEIFSNLQSKKSINKAELPFKESINFDGISYAFQDGKEILKNINLQFKFGENIAIIGPSGSGKSTLLDLLLGFIHPDEGKIFVDGISLSPANKESIRNNFSYVPQKVQLIEGTLKENILFGSSEIDLDEAKLRETLRLANLDQVIESLPDGLETVLSDTNQYVSGGQKQCIGFARALYKGGNVLILDEATNAMDQNLEQRMMENISIAGFKMIIGITHKGSTLNYFNKICILKDGTLDGFDSLSELAKDNKFLLEMLR